MGTFKFFAISIGALVLALAAVHAAWFGSPPVFPLDDTYITLHNAIVLVTGTDINYPGIPALTGTTSPIHLALVSFLSLVLPPLWALQVAAWIGIFLFALGTFRLANTCQAKHWQAGLLVVLGLILGRMPHHLLNGLETGLALAGLVWAIDLAFEKSPRYPWLLPLVCGQLPFLRPELGVVSILLPIARALQGWQYKDGCSALMRLLIRDILILVIATLPWIFWHLASTGSFYPSTIAAKRLFFAEGCLPKVIKISWIKRSVWQLVQTLGIVSLAVLGLFVTWPGRAGLIFILTLIITYYIQFPGALGHYEQRYLYVFIPFLLFGVVSLWQTRDRILHLLVSGLVVIALVQSAFEFPSRWQYYQRTLGFTQHELKEVADWCRNNLSPNSILLVHDTGYIAYATSFHLVDFVGLKTPSSIQYNKNITWASCGLKRPVAVSQIAIEGRANYLIMLQGWDSIYHISDSLRRLGWIITPVRPFGAYRVHSMQSPKFIINH